MIIKKMMISSLLCLFIFSFGCGSDEPVTEQETPVKQSPPDQPESEVVRDTSVSGSLSSQPEAEPSQAPAPSVAAPPATTAANSTVVENDDPPVFRGTIGVSERHTPDAPVATLQGIRIGHHPGYDRIVFDFDGVVAPGYYVEYANHPVYDCSTVDTVAVTQPGRLLVRISPTRAHTDNAASTLEQTQYTWDFTHLKEARMTCDVDDEMTWLMGISRKRPYRAFSLANPPRFVVDIRK